MPMELEVRFTREPNAVLFAHRIPQRMGRYLSETKQRRSVTTQYERKVMLFTAC